MLSTELKCKTIVKTKKVYSIEGREFFFEWTDESLEPLKNLLHYALNDCNRGEAPFTVFVEESGSNLTFEVKTIEDRDRLKKILEQAIIDIK